MDHSLKDRLDQAFASLTFLGSPMLTVLDELQVALNAPRLDAVVVEDNNNQRRISSAVSRESESEEDGREWTETVTGSLHDSRSKTGVNWSLEVAAVDVRPGSTIRKGLSACRQRLKFQFDKPFQFDQRHSSLIELTLWLKPGTLPDDSIDSSAEAQGFFFVINNALMKGANEGPPANPLNENFEAFEKLADPAARTFLKECFESFDLWLKRLLEAHLDKQNLDKAIVKYDFLNQFFWVTERKPAKVMPVFLGRQWEGLVEQWTRLECSPDPPSHPERGIEWIHTYELDSDSLFSAFPADTGLSLYVEDWPHEPLSLNPRLPLDKREDRKTFFRLTRNAHEDAARRAGFDTDNRLNLFSVPVLVGGKPLLVVTMSLPIPLDERTRAALAGPIRALGGIMRLHANIYDRGKEKSYATKCSRMSNSVTIADVVSRIVGNTPVKVADMRSKLEDAERKNTECISARDFVDAINWCDHVWTNAGRVVAEYKGTEDEIDLTDALRRANMDVPKSRPIRLTPEPSVRYIVKAIPESLDFAFSEIIKRATGLCSEGQSITVRLIETVGKSSPQGVIRIEFLDNRRAGARPLFGTDPESDRDFDVAHRELVKMNGEVEFDQEVLEVDDDSGVRRYACCVVSLPLIRK
jgi:hypothetical protein